MNLEEFYCKLTSLTDINLIRIKNNLPFFNFISKKVLWNSFRQSLNGNIAQPKSNQRHSERTFRIKRKLRHNNKIICPCARVRILPPQVSQVALLRTHWMNEKWNKYGLYSRHPVWSVFQWNKMPKNFLNICNLVIYLDSTNWALYLVDSWSRAPDQIQMYPDRDTIAQLLPSRRLCLFVLLYDCLREINI